VTDFRQAGHLPKVRGDQGADPRGLPRQRRGVTPQMHGRYPDYDVLAEEDHWDDVTRRVVRARVDAVPALTFFSEDEASTLTAFADLFLHQDSEPRIPVLNFVDAKLAAGRLEGYQYADMPDDRDAWRLVAAGLNEAAEERDERSFAGASTDVQEAVIDDFAAGRLSGASWAKLSVEHAWSVVTRDLLTAFYAHPWAFNEIGFGGPAYPRGYARLGIGFREEWEGEEALDLDPVEDVKERGLA
jgi:hypothetical protein